MRFFLIPLLSSLILPTAVRAFPWNKDIEIVNDVGEKIIVKESTITTQNLFKNDLLKLLDKRKDSLEESVASSSRSLSSTNTYLIDTLYSNKRFYCQQGWRRQESLCNNTLVSIQAYEKKRDRQQNTMYGYKKELEELETKKKLLLQDESNIIHKVVVYFKPIFVDLNQTKTVGSIEKVYCLNSDLKKEYQKYWYDFVSSAEKLLFSYGELSKKLCQKHANIDISQTNIYTITQDKDTEEKDTPLYETEEGMKNYF